MVEILTPDDASLSSLPVVLTNAGSALSVEWKIASGNSAGRISTGSGRSVELTGTGRVDGFIPDGSTGAQTTLFLSTLDGGPAPLPEAYSLEQNYPNPFNGATIIPFSLVAESHVTLEIFNVLGQKVLTLVDRTLGPGVHSASLGTERIPTGIFMYRLTAENSAGHRFVADRKLVHVK